MNKQIQILVKPRMEFGTPEQNTAFEPAYGSDFKNFIVLVWGGQGRLRGMEELILILDLVRFYGGDLKRVLDRLYYPQAASYTLIPFSHEGWEYWRAIWKAHNRL